MLLIIIVNLFFFQFLKNWKFTSSNVVSNCVPSNCAISKNIYQFIHFRWIKPREKLREIYSKFLHSYIYYIHILLANDIEIWQKCNVENVDIKFLLQSAMHPKRHEYFCIRKKTQKKSIARDPSSNFSRVDGTRGIPI